MHNGAIWSIATDAANRYLVSGGPDKTVRLWSLPQLSLFVASDRKRWVLVSPSGFYDASVVGEDLVGWHVNRGREEAADFFPVSRLRARFYRPEVIDGIIDKADDADIVTFLHANQSWARVLMIACMALK